MSEQNVLEFDQVSKAFGGLQAINNLSFHVKPGEILGLIGPNGAGKTTVFNLIMGVYRPDHGTIRFKEDEINGWKPYRIVNAGVARTFQIPKPFHLKTIAKNVEIALIPNSILGRDQRHAFKNDNEEVIADRKRKISELCSDLGICKIFGYEKCSREVDGLCSCELEFPSALPHAGMRNLEIAKAMAMKPELLLLDEPFAGLTMSEVDEMSKLLIDMKKTGLTQVIVDHNMKGLMKLVDRVVVINFGQKLMEGSPEEVAEDPRVQEAYLAGTGT